MKTLRITFTFIGFLAILSCHREEIVLEQQNNVIQENNKARTSQQSYTLTAHHFSTGEGYWEEAPLHKINRKDQSGTNDNWNKYIELVPGNRKFRGYLTYYLPEGVNKSDIASITVKTNYKGEKSNVQKWTWRIKNYDSNHWDYLGNNSFASDWRWSYKSWTKNSNKYIKSSNNKIQIKLYSNNNRDVCDIDYLVVVVKLRNNNANVYTPAVGTSFDWILSGNLPSVSSIDATAVDIDPFTEYDNGRTPDAGYVRQLHNAGKKAIAYISVGTWEDWRDDAGDFPNSVKGNNMDDWDGEKFLDIRQIDVLRPIMHERFRKAKEMGYDAIEADNIDLYTYTRSQLGFSISTQDVIEYCQMLSEEAHGLGLSIGQKNAAELSNRLEEYFDWALLEDVFYEASQNDAELDDSSIYIRHNKAVFATEYSDNMTQSQFTNNVCPEAHRVHFTAIYKDRDLHAPIITCD